MYSFAEKSPQMMEVKFLPMDNGAYSTKVFPPRSHSAVTSETQKLMTMNLGTALKQGLACTESEAGVNLNPSPQDDTGLPMMKEQND